MYLVANILTFSVLLSQDVSKILSGDLKDGAGNIIELSNEITFQVIDRNYMIIHFISSLITQIL